MTERAIATFTVIQVTEIHDTSVRSPQRKVLLQAQRPDFQIELLHSGAVKVGAKVELVIKEENQ